MQNEEIISEEILSNIYYDSCAIIEEARNNAFRSINTALTMRNWRLGERIAKENLDDEKKAKYGKSIITNLSAKLTNKFGKGLDYSSLYQYVKFYRLFPDILDAVNPKSDKIDSSRPNLLPWTLYRELIRVENTNARKWYEQEASREMWSYRTLHRNIASQYYFRLSNSEIKSNVSDEMHLLTAPYQQDKLEFIKNPVVAEFLGLPSNKNFTESLLEDSIINHLQHFILEMGKGFAFVSRQKHIRTDMGDFYIDLVFYNYILKCFFLIDLKTSQISHQDVGQMDMYVRMYDQLQRTNGDNPTIGLLLCSETSEDMARYSILHGNEQIFQAKYLTCLPTKDELIREIELQKEIFQQQKDQQVALKKELRKQVRMLKKECSAEELEQKSLAAVAKLEKHPLFVQAQRVMLYASLPDEVQTIQLIEKYRHTKQIILPTVVGDDIIPVAVDDDTDFAIGDFNIPEPQNKPYLGEYDLIVVPGMAFDKNGNRLGRGKGYYDRFLSSHKNVKRIGLCFDFQLADAIPTEPTDIPVDEVIS